MILSTGGLTKRYGTRTALDQVDLEIAEGSIYGLVGRNGAGKSTLLSILAGLRRADAGEVFLGTPREHIAVCPDVPAFEPWLTAREVLALASSLTRAGEPPGELDRRLAEAGLADAADRRVGGFSRGMTQRLALAATFVGSPRLVLLDEPCSALDPAGRAEVLDLIAAHADGTTVVFSTHVLADIERVCDSVGVLDRGRLIYQGSLRDLLTAHHRPAWRVRVRRDRDTVAAALARRPWVVSAEPIGPDTIGLAATSAAAAEADLARALAEAGAEIVAVTPESADLESVFLALTAPGAAHAAPPPRRGTDEPVAS